nr:Ku protein [Modestobacter versicolor]
MRRSPLRVADHAAWPSRAAGGGLQRLSCDLDETGVAGPRGQEVGVRSIWKGAVSFGLVSIGVKLYSATEDHDIRFHQVHKTDGGRVKYKRVCSVDGEEVEYNDIAKGYELPDGQLVVLTDEDFDQLPLGTTHEIEVLQFVDQEQIDPIHFEKTYYLEPDGVATRPYVLLRTALENAGQVAITKIAIRQRESLAALRVREGVLVLHTMRWPDEIRRPGFGFLDEEVPVRPQELAMAESLISTMAGDFDASAFTDDYREAMQALLEAKQSGGEVQQAPDAVDDGGGAVVDLMSALRRSVERAGGSAPAGGDDSADDDEDSAADAAPAKKTAARKPAKKATTAATKAPAKKAPAKKAAAAKADDEPAKPAKRASRARKTA